MKTYTIKQGNHYCNGLNFKLHNNLNQLNFKAKLSSNCLYHFVTINFHIDLLREENRIDIYRLDTLTEYNVNYPFANVSTMGYYNYPYFGGNKVAPHLMNVGIE